jgi:hypothetical protein
VERLSVPKRTLADGAGLGSASIADGAGERDLRRTVWERAGSPFKTATFLTAATPRFGSHLVLYGKDLEDGRGGPPFLAMLGRQPSLGL